MPDYSWLPDHQLHVAATVAHANDLIATAASLLYDYLKPGPLQFSTVVEGDTAHVVVVAVAPLPEGVARYVADAMTQLRTAIEHTVFAEVEHQLGRKLDEREVRLIEMPASTTPADFDKWVGHRHRRELVPLRAGSGLIARIRELQPFQANDSDQHPLRVLAEHTNHAKHRAPIVGATQLGVIIPDAHESPLTVYFPAQDRQLQPGDVLASGPLHPQVGLDIWPKVSIQRPHTGEWRVVINELAELERWVRTVAVPHLITGGEVGNHVPAGLNIGVGHPDLRAALTVAATMPAAERATRRIQAESLRGSLAETLAMHDTAPAIAVIHAWVGALSDDEVLERLDRLAAPVVSGDLAGTDRVVRVMIAEIA